MAVTVHVSLSLPYRLDQSEVMVDLFDTWAHIAPALLPTHAGLTEPVRPAFDPAQIATRDDLWAAPSWLAVRRRPRVEIHLMNGYWVHSVVLISIAVNGPAEADQVRQLGLALADALEPDFGLVHVLSQAEADDARSVGRPDVATINRISRSFSLSAGYTKQLAGGIPTLYWVTMFGRPYVDLLSTEVIARCVPRSDARRWGMVAQLSDEAPSDGNWLDFSANREGAIRCLGADLFWPGATRIPDQMARTSDSAATPQRSAT